MYLEGVGCWELLSAENERVRGREPGEPGQNEMLHAFTFALHLSPVWKGDLSDYVTSWWRIIYLTPRKWFRSAWKALFEPLGASLVSRSKTFQMSPDGTISKSSGHGCMKWVKMQWVDNWMDEWMDRIALVKNEMWWMDGQMDGQNARFNRKNPTPYIPKSANNAGKHKRKHPFISRKNGG